VYDARAIATPWTPAEKEAIKAHNKEYEQEQQEAARYECRHTMTNVIRFEIVQQGLTNLLMRTEAAKVAGKSVFLLFNVVWFKKTFSNPLFLPKCSFSTKNAFLARFCVCEKRPYRKKGETTLLDLAYISDDKTTFQILGRFFLVINATDTDTTNADAP
jgi:hypothetical protein